ncbi:hypothetical protein DFP72DRAFT_852932 [Ephemerocybe angulata]|uniref:Uncharacterized protein n=1 Tax=Ephemerocybe angulata TaxID=980116 RepID=A0A8H6M1R7_9AGAR|nr:hypothetical protein DFP72DRAFT_852932 [Tulosesus angulatus]
MSWEGEVPGPPLFDTARPTYRHSRAAPYCSPPYQPGFQRPGLGLQCSYPTQLNPLKAVREMKPKQVLAPKLAPKELSYKKRLIADNTTSTTPGQIILPRLLSIPGDVPQVYRPHAVVALQSPFQTPGRANAVQNSSPDGDWAYPRQEVAVVERRHRSPYMLREGINRAAVNELIRQQVEPHGHAFDKQYLRQASIKKFNPKAHIVPLSNTKLLYTSASAFADGITISQLGRILRACTGCQRYIFADRCSSHNCDIAPVDVTQESFYLPHMMMSGNCPGLTPKDIEVFYEVQEIPYLPSGELEYIIGFPEHKLEII